MTTTTFDYARAYTRTPAPAVGTAGLLGFLEWLSRFSAGAKCAREAEILSQRSDAELARRGLTRDRIVHHAFQRFIYR